MYRINIKYCIKKDYTNNLLRKYFIFVKETQRNYITGTTLIFGISVPSFPVIVYMSSYIEIHFDLSFLIFLLHAVPRLEQSRRNLVLKHFVPLFFFPCIAC